MSERILIDALAFARNGERLEGTVPVERLLRVSDCLADTSGMLQYSIQGETNDRQTPCLRIAVQGVLTLFCQRCLEGVSHRVHLESVLDCVRDESALTREEIEDTMRDFLVAQGETDLLALVEDEVILNLPIAPRHEDCVLPDARNGVGALASPFAALASLKRGGIR